MEWVGGGAGGVWARVLGIGRCGGLGMAFLTPGSEIEDVTCLVEGYAEGDSIDEGLANGES